MLVESTIIQGKQQVDQENVKPPQTPQSHRSTKTTAVLKQAGAKVLNIKHSSPVQQPVLNGKYALLSRLGEGNTSKVYLA